VGILADGQVVRSRRCLLVITSLYVVLAVVRSLLTPIGEAPDEPAHFAYVQYVITQRALPPPQPPQRGHFFENDHAVSLYEWYQPPLYYGMVALPVALVQWLHPNPQQFPPINRQFARGATRLFIAPANRALEIVLTPVVWRVARFVSIALGVLTLLTTYRLARVSAPDDRTLALAATGFMAFIPQFTFITGCISNDNLADLLSAASLLAFAQLVAANDVRALALIVAGWLVALAMLTKLTTLFLLPLGLLALLLRRPARAAFAREASLFVVASLSLPGLTLLAPAVRAQMAFVVTSLQVQSDHLSVKYVLDLFPLTNASLWGRFGWMNVPSPAWMVNAFDLIALVGLCGSVVMGFRGSRPLRRQVLLLWGACLLVLIAFVRFNLAVRQPQGRLLFPALSAFAVLVALGVLRAAGRYRMLVAFGLVCCTLALNLVSLWGVLTAYSLGSS